jgi:hypothetical protein
VKLNRTAAPKAKGGAESRFEADGEMLRAGESCFTTMGRKTPKDVAGIADRMFTARICQIL